MAVKTIDVKTLKQWLENNEALVIDVREPKEHESIHIPNSQLIPLASLCKEKLPQDSGKKIVIHCHSGRRSSNACLKLLQEDPSLEIYNLEGGISSWSNAGHEVNCAEKKTLPLEQQVQLIIGVFLILFSFIGLISNSLSIFLISLIGAGLIYSGLTGQCYLFCMLKMMPWNKVQGNEMRH